MVVGDTFLTFTYIPVMVAGDGMACDGRGVSVIMYVYDMYVHMFVCMYVCRNVGMYGMNIFLVCMYVCMHVCLFDCMHVCKVCM